jgi:hypothetical protein
MLCFEKTGHGLRATDTETGEQRVGLMPNEAQLVAFSWARGERMAFTAPDPPPAVLNHGDDCPDWDKVPMEHKWRVKAGALGWITARTISLLVNHLDDIDFASWETLSQRPEARDA